jgi:hypothetical protein
MSQRITNYDRINRAIRGLKHCGRFHYISGEDPNPLDCSLAGRVAHIFGVGMTAACLMCRDAGEDPEYSEEQEPVCCGCYSLATCKSINGDHFCDDCCAHDEQDECNPIEEE